MAAAMRPFAVSTVATCFAVIFRRPPHWGSGAEYRDALAWPFLHLSVRQSVTRIFPKPPVHTSPNCSSLLPVDTYIRTMYIATKNCENKSEALKCGSVTLCGPVNGMWVPVAVWQVRLLEAAASAFRQPSPTCRTAFTAQHLRPSGVLGCWPDGLELAPGFYPGSNEQHRLF